MSPYTLGKISYYFSTCEPSTIDRRCVHRRGCTDQREHLDTLHTLYNQQQLKAKLKQSVLKLWLNIHHSIHAEYRDKGNTIILSVLQT